jgi:hypothetical protein
VLQIVGESFFLVVAAAAASSSRFVVSGSTLTASSSPVVTSSTAFTVIVSAAAIASVVIVAARIVLVVASARIVRLVVRLIIVAVLAVVMFTSDRRPTSITRVGRGVVRRRRRRCDASLSSLFGPAFVDWLDDGRFVEENDSRFRVAGIAGVLEVTEVHVGHSLVGFKDHANAKGSNKIYYKMFKNPKTFLH